LLAVVDSLKSFRHYLLGRKFMIRTDHVSLKWLMSFKDLEGQLARWLERLQEFEFEIVHRKEQSHKNAEIDYRDGYVRQTDVNIALRSEEKARKRPER